MSGGSSELAAIESAYEREREVSSQLAEALERKSAEIVAERAAREKAERERDTLLEALQLAAPLPWRAPDKSAEFLAEHGEAMAYTEASDARGNDIGDFHYHGDDAARVMGLAVRVNAIASGRADQDAALDSQPATEHLDSHESGADQRMFPVLYHRLDERGSGLPACVPWSLVAPHERQAQRNHGGQSLERLAQRGGLIPLELYLVVHDRDLVWPVEKDREEALAWLRGVSHGPASASSARVGEHTIDGATGKCVDCGATREHATAFRLCEGGTGHGE